VSLKDVRIGIPSNFFFDRIDPHVATAVRRAADFAASEGAQVSEIPLSDFDALSPVGRVIQLAEASSVLGRYANRRSEFGSIVLFLTAQGAVLPATQYLNAQRVRSLVTRSLAQIWQKIDLLLAPATPMPAPKIGEMVVTLGTEREDVRIAGTRLTRPFNVLG